MQQVVGAGQQQVRFIWANVGAFHVCLWTFTMTEAWAWGRNEEELVDRSTSPWDSPLRRPSHADKRRAWRRALLGEELRAVLRPGVTEGEIQAAALQFVRKVSGFNKPSAANEAAFQTAVEEIAAASDRLLRSLKTNAPTRNREDEAAKARARNAERFPK